MKTISIQIGNTDNRLTQQQWHSFVKAIDHRLRGLEVQFFGGSSNWELWQNAAWILSVREHDNIDQLRVDLALIRRDFNQDSLAWTEGETFLI